MYKHNLTQTNKAYFGDRHLQCVKCEVYVYKNIDDLIKFFAQDSGLKVKRVYYNCRVLYKNKTYIFHPKTGKRESIDYCPMSDNDYIAKSIIK